MQGYAHVAGHGAVLVANYLAQLHPRHHRDSLLLLLLRQVEVLLSLHGLAVPAVAEFLLSFLSLFVPASFEAGHVTRRTLLLYDQQCKAIRPVWQIFH